MVDTLGRLQEALASPQIREQFPIVAIDVGNNRAKCGLYPLGALVAGQPPAAEVSLSQLPSELPKLEGFLEGRSIPGGWWIATVNRATSTELLDWIRTRRPEDRIVLLTASDLPLAVNLPRPDMVGIDRLVDALAAVFLRRQPGPIVVVDIGSAITVDYVSGQGIFEGGAILPGIGLAARALYEFTDMLPLVDINDLAGPPPAIGKNTVAAMKSGLFWGALGAVAELAGRMLRGTPSAGEIVLTGGGSTVFAQLLAQDPAIGTDLRPAEIGTTEIELDHFGQKIRLRHVPHLTLLGIALAAAYVMATSQWF